MHKHFPLYVSTFYLSTKPPLLSLIKTEQLGTSLFSSLVLFNCVISIYVMIYTALSVHTKYSLWSTWCHITRLTILHYYCHLSLCFEEGYYCCLLFFQNCKLIVYAILLLKLFFCKEFYTFKLLLYLHWY